MNVALVRRGSVEGLRAVEAAARFLENHRGLPPVEPHSADILGQVQSEDASLHGLRLEVPSQRLKPLQIMN